MTVTHRHKNRRHRGTRTCGWGKCHRGSGQRGGVGNAGSGKRADQKKPTQWDRAWGRHGFISKGGAQQDITINISAVEARMAQWLANGQASENAGIISIDLGKLGYTKLLGSGKVTHKLNIKVPNATAGVKMKLVAAGGKLDTGAVEAAE